MSKAKKIGIACVIMVLACFIVNIISNLCKPLNNYITIDALLNNVSNNSYILIKTENEYYELKGTPNLKDLFDFELWQQQDKSPTGELLLTIRLAELWIIELYSDGEALAHYGYSLRGEKSEAYYNIPKHVLDNLFDYIKQYGIRHEFGDGTISSSTFNY